MWTEVIRLVVSNGVFAVLFVGLLVYILKDSKMREEKYQNTITHLAKHLDVIEEIDEDIKQIKKVVYGLDEDEEKQTEEKCEDEGGKNEKDSEQV